MNDIETLLRLERGRGGDGAKAAAERFAARAAAHGDADVAYGTADSPLGPLLLAVTPRGLVTVGYPERAEDDVLARLAAEVSPRIVAAAAPLDPVRRELEEYFDGRRREFSLALDWRLAGAFTRRVLGATAAIPYGGTSTYGEIAKAAGSPRGSRAAGNALGANPLPIVVPCHRVLRHGGVLGGYAGGPERKRYLLALEGAMS